jgi:hypothetical protein
LGAKEIGDKDEIELKGEILLPRRVLALDKPLPGKNSIHTVQEWDEVATPLSFRPHGGTNADLVWVSGRELLPEPRIELAGVLKSALLGFLHRMIDIHAGSSSSAPGRKADSWGALAKTR